MSSTDLDHNNKLIIGNAAPKIQDQEEILKGGVGFGVVVLRNINDGLDDCHTPTEDENKIPIMLAPPPAPRKPVIKRKLIACKRKLFGEIQVSQIVVKSEEIDAFFKASYEELAAGKSAMVVKRCKCK